jgi:hypothetical protein
MGGLKVSAGAALRAGSCSSLISITTARMCSAKRSDRARRFSGCSTRTHCGILIPCIVALCCMLLCRPQACPGACLLLLRDVQHCTSRVHVGHISLCPGVMQPQAVLREQCCSCQAAHGQGQAGVAHRIISHAGPNVSQCLTCAPPSATLVVMARNTFLV